MKHIFSPAGKRALGRINPREWLLAFDFDGTLTPIASRPNLAYTDPSFTAQLKRLVRCAKVAVISGRSRADLRTRVGFRPHLLLGNHGVESPWDMARAKFFARVVESWRHQLDLSAAGQGALIENKRYSLSLHHRHALNRARAARVFRTQAARLDPPPRLVGGKMVVNVIPAGAPDKGSALLKAMAVQRRSRALFVGDDLTDEDAFALPRRQVLSVRVGFSRRSRAQFFVRDQREVGLLLAELLRGFGAQ